ncbi:hypothetical protein ACFQY5_29185 [Paeniroseomonas aquatica]|uniref:hypothetical protein n=1 Tax=Paeniroseomonas aquatica TaxID=373043 RepID=UPI00360794B6
MAEPSPVSRFAATKPIASPTGPAGFATETGAAAGAASASSAFSALLVGFPPGTQSPAEVSAPVARASA